jgi:conjugative relaxase-like TrwC/TraI family protein
MRGAGQGNYYLQLAREDYYLQGGEPPGQWHGVGAKLFSLSGTVEKDDLRNLLSGFSPKEQVALVQNAGAKDRQSGWDLTFSAPKSVSVLWSQVGRNVRGKIEAAQQAAVETALDFLEANCAFTRRGRGGEGLERTPAIFATFEHGTSRACDPQLHTHALLLNLAFRADGTTGTVVSREFFRNKMLAGAIYQAELAYRLSSVLGVAIERTKASFEVKGVPRDLCDTFSKRRQEILQELRARGVDNAVAAKIAALNTRQQKEHVPREKLLESWREVGQALGWTHKQAEALLQKPAPDHKRDRLAKVRELLEALKNKGLKDGKLLFAAVKIGLQQGFSGNDVLTALATTRKPLLEVRTKILFPNAPNWSPVKDLALPYLKFQISPTKHWRWGKVISERKVGPLKLQLREKYLFPNAPKWSPVHAVSLPAFRLKPEAPARAAAPTKETPAHDH